MSGIYLVSNFVIKPNEMEVYNYIISSHDFYDLRVDCVEILNSTSVRNLEGTILRGNT